MKKIFALLTIVFGFSTAAQAGLLIEPYLGYYYGTTISRGVTSSIDVTDTSTGLGYGLRLGYKFMVPWVAIDYSASSGTNETDYPPGTANVDYAWTGIGVSVGADLPLGLRIFGGYGFTDKAVLKYTSGDDTLTGSYTKVGLGFRLIPMLSLNAEYIMHSYTKYDNGTTKVDLDTVYSSFSSNAVLVSISAPLNL